MIYFLAVKIGQVLILYKNTLKSIISKNPTRITKRKKKEKKYVTSGAMHATFRGKMIKLYLDTERPTKL